MSRVGRAPLVLPPGVTLHVADARVRAEGPKGKLERSLDGDVTVTVEGNAVRVTRRDDSRRARSIHGLTRVLVGCMLAALAVAVAASWARGASLANLGGALACCIGALVTMPITFGAMMYAYEDLFGTRPAQAA